MLRCLDGDRNAGNSAGRPSPLRLAHAGILHGDLGLESACAPVLSSNGVKWCQDYEIYINILFFMLP